LKNKRNESKKFKILPVVPPPALFSYILGFVMLFLFVL